MVEGIAIERNGHRTWLKWHRGHKQAGDISFTPERIAEGLAAGASVEIDLVRHAGGGFAVLHDETLDRETTGTGPVAEASAQTIRSLRLRDRAGKPTQHSVMLIGDLGRLLAQAPETVGGLLQLDLKEGHETITEADIAAFAEAMAPVRSRVILSGGDALALPPLVAAVPGLRIGYDPCYEGAADAAVRSGAYADFVATAISAMPSAEMIYLEYPLVLAADRAGFDLVAAFHAHGRTIDAYTVNQVTPATLAAVHRLLDLKCDQITTDDPVGLHWAVMEAGL